MNVLIGREAQSMRKPLGSSAGSGRWRWGAWVGLVLAAGCQSPLPQANLEQEAARVALDVHVAAHAPEEADAGDAAGAVLGEDEAIRRAMLHDPRIQAALASVLMARADAQQARLLPNPILTAGIRLREAAGDPVIDVGIAADVLSILQTPRRVSAADSRLRKSVSDALVTLLDVLEETEESYNTVQVVEQELAALQEREALAHRLVELAQARVRAGEAGQLDLISLQTLELSARVDLAAKMQERTEARLNLARLVGEPSSTPNWRLWAWRVPAAPATAEGPWLAQALRSRPEIRAQRWELAAMGDELALARLAALEGGDAGAQAEQDVDWSVGPAITTPLPVFDWGQAKQAKISAGQLQARHQMTQIQRQVIQEVRTQHAAFAESMQTLRLAREQLLPLLEKRAELAERAYRAGEGDIAGLLLAQQEMVDARVKVIELGKAAALARIKLERAVGGAGVARQLERASTQPATTRGSQP